MTASHHRIPIFEIPNEKNMKMKILSVALLVIAVIATPSFSKNVKNKKMDSQLNSTSVNPIVNSRDRALNS